MIAIDFRGFGTSDPPPAAVSNEQELVSDVLDFLDVLGIDQVTLAGHDIGATVAQGLARRAPDRVSALALFNPTNPGIGDRRYAPEHQREVWYQHFHLLPWAEALLGRDTVELYLRHFYDHWVGRKEAVRPIEFQAIVDMYARPGAVGASFAWYRGRVLERRRQAAADPHSRIIHQPTVIRWGDADPVCPSCWSDRLEEFFTL